MYTCRHLEMYTFIHSLHLYIYTFPTFIHNDLNSENIFNDV